MAAQKYPKTLAAVKAAEGNQWAIGDAVLEEVGAPAEHGKNVGTYAAIRECAAELASRGFEYTPNALRKLRDTAFAFPDARRRASLSFNTHVEAGSPDVLAAVLKHYGKRVVTRAEVREYKKIVNAARQEKQQVEQQRLDTEAQQARERAEKEGTEEAKQAAEEAEEQAQQAVKGSQQPDPERDEVERMRAWMKYQEYCLSVEEIAEKARKLLAEFDFTDRDITSPWHEAGSAWADVFNDPPGEERKLRSVK